MKKLLLFLFLIINTGNLFSQVSIGTTTPDNSSILDIESSNSGVLFPRLTQVQRDAIANPATGLLIYNSSTNYFQYNSGTPGTSNWKSLAKNKYQSGTHNVGSTSTGWNYHAVTFATTYTGIPSILLTFREGTGVDNDASYTTSHIKVANASTTGFTIAIYDNATTFDIFIDWIAFPKTQ